MSTEVMRKTLLVGAFALAMLSLSPSVSYAQYVPVQDEDLISDFGTFSDNFDDYSDNFDDYAEQMNDALTEADDSLRNIIAGGDPSGVAKDDCLREDTTREPEPYDPGAWRDASAIENSTIPTTKTVQINKSASLRCLLQELVEWQKLELSLQIHALLKTYISDAQTKQLNNQLKNKISAANLKASQSANEVTNADGTRTNEPVYNTNASQSLNNVKARQLDHITAQAAADPAGGNAVGSLATYQDWRLDATADMVRNNQFEVTDPFYSTRSLTESSLDSFITPGGWSGFQSSYDSPDTMVGGGASQMFQEMLMNPTASPFQTSVQLTQIAAGNIERQEEATKAEAANSGYKPTKVCSGLPEDPFCLSEQYQTAVTPADRNRQFTNDYSSNDDQLNDVTLDGGAATSAQNQSTEIGTQQTGLYGYDETDLANSGTVVNQLVREFYDVIEVGYFDITRDTTDWAQATMLMIYDEMKFNPRSTETTVTRGTDPEPTGYGN